MKRFRVNVTTKMSTDFYIAADDAQDARHQVEAMFEDGRADWPDRKEALDGRVVWYLAADEPDEFYVEEEES